VSFDEAQSVFLDDWEYIYPDPEHSVKEERFLIAETSSKRRLLIVSFTERSGRIRLISARKVTRAERTRYEKDIQ
jgi:hypothetical protein